LYQERSNSTISPPADAGVQTLRNALDDAALAGGVAPFEDHHDLQLLVHHPVLQLHELALQAEQLVEVEVAVERIARSLVLNQLGEFRGARVVELHLELLVDAVDQLTPDLIPCPSLAVAAHMHSRPGKMPAGAQWCRPLMMVLRQGARRREGSSPQTVMAQTALAPEVTNPRAVCR
jgi:hypothetical protein